MRLIRHAALEVIREVKALYDENYVKFLKVRVHSRVYKCYIMDELT